MYYYLKKGEIVQDGDEVEMSAKYNDPPKWVKASIHSIGTPAPDPGFIAHRLFRRKVTCEGRPISEILQEKADEAKDEKIVAALMNANISGLSKDEAKANLKNIVDEILSE